MIALHGFLGRPDDFAPIPGIDLFAEKPQPFWEWAHTFNQHHSGTFLGYSMGGRLGLHALIENPGNWERAIIISAHPGLCREDRRQRLEKDALWAAKFREGEWEKVIAEWNQQPVFKHDDFLSRKENEYNRDHLADAITTWSLGAQEDLSHSIASLPMQIEWFVGEYDRRFVKLGRELRFAHKNSKLTIVPRCGHRVFLKNISTSINSCKNFI